MSEPPPFEPPPMPDTARPLPPTTSATEDAEDDEDADFEFPDEAGFPAAGAGVIWAGNVPTPPPAPPRQSASAPPRHPAPPSQQPTQQPAQPSREPSQPRHRAAEPAAGRAAPTTPATGRATPTAGSRATPAMPPAAPPPPATPPRVQNPVSRSISGSAADPSADQDEMRRALSSVRTRIDVVENHIAKLSDALSTMRRRFVHGTFRDIEPMQPKAERQFRAAKEMFTIAERRASSGDWAVVRTAIADVRRTLEEATAAAAEVTARLATLEKLADDPKGPVDRARFVVRDAQRLFQMLSPNVSAEYGRRLDALAQRVETAGRAASLPRPNYWDLHNELTAIKDETQSTIVQMRAARA
jgi:hypothetical protein